MKLKQDSFKTVLKLFSFSRKKRQNSRETFSSFANHIWYPLFMQNCCLSCCQSNFS